MLLYVTFFELCYIIRGPISTFIIRFFALRDGTYYTNDFVIFYKYYIFRLLMDTAGKPLFLLLDSWCLRRLETQL
jgi:hypothetical protein